jgi:hypothetical protein
MPDDFENPQQLITLRPAEGFPVPAAERNALRMIESIGLFIVG